MRCGPRLVTCLLVASGCAAPAVEQVSIDSASSSQWQCSSRVELSSLWATLARRHDSNGDGRITLAEYSRGSERFANYDRNEDGVLDAADFPEDAYFNGFSHMILRFADADDDQSVTLAEWQALSQGIDGNGDGIMQQEEVVAVMGGWAEDWPLFLLSFDQDGDGDFDLKDLDLTFGDQDFNGDDQLVGNEMRGWQRTVDVRDSQPPEVGGAAPDFTLPYAHDPSQQFQLQDPARERPVALIFGSYT